MICPRLAQARTQKLLLFCFALLCGGSSSAVATNGSILMKPSKTEQCFARLGSKTTLDADVYCNATWDTVLCWAAAYPNTTVLLPCPALHGLDTSKFARRVCGPNGIWMGKNPGDFENPQGYTFYTDCYTEHSKRLIEKYRHFEHIKEITNSARTLEIVGLCVSLVSTILSLVIFCYYRSLRCHRTRIHKNLFVAIIVQIAMRIILVVDQDIARMTGGEVAGASSGSSGALYDTPILCETMYALIEYTKTVKFMWMFVEGLYLHNMIAVAFFSGRPNYLLFYSLGWGVPVVVLTAWIIPMTQVYRQKCWFAYYYVPLIWILEGPRTAVMAVNLGFLLNIIRVLVMKLRETHTNEAKRVRKAVKAAIILLPLLGLTNFFVMLEPAGDDIIVFAVWIFSAHFLTDFEGFFISLIYCFLNGEVQSAIKHQLFRHMPPTYSMDLSTTHWRNTTTKVKSAVKRQMQAWTQHRLIHSSSFRRLSRSFSVFTSLGVNEGATTPQLSHHLQPELLPHHHQQQQQRQQQLQPPSRSPSLRLEVGTPRARQKDNSDLALSEVNGTVGNGAATPGGATPTATASLTTTNGQVKMPLLRFASRRFRRTSAREVSSVPRFQLTEPLQTDQVQEQEI